jgi:hypothetical protein
LQGPAKNFIDRPSFLAAAAPVAPGCADASQPWPVTIDSGSTHHQPQRGLLAG